jgi:hypothetical protein
MALGTAAERFLACQQAHCTTTLERPYANGIQRHVEHDLTRLLWRQRNPRSVSDAADVVAS